MKVFFVAHELHPQRGTIERHTLNLALQFSRMGHAVTILAIRPSGFAPETVRDEYVSEGLRVLSWSAPRISEYMQDYVTDSSAEAFLREILGESRPDVVHVMHPRWIPQLRAENSCRHIPLFIHLNDYWFVCPRTNLIRGNGSLCTGAREGINCEKFCSCSAEWATNRIAWARKELSLANGVFLSSTFLRDVFESQGFETERWHYVPRGIDYSRLGTALGGIPRSYRPGQVLKIRCLGGDLPHQGAQVMIEGAKLAAVSPLEITIHGNQSNPAQHRDQLRREAGIDGRILFAQSPDYGKLEESLAGTYLVIYPALWYETFPIAALTAIAMGIPLIASDLGTMRELVQRYKAGFLFPPGDAIALSRLLVDLAANHDRLREIQAQMLQPPSLEEEAYQIETVCSESLA